jgi:hypothetical protein
MFSTQVTHTYYVEVESVRNYLLYKLGLVAMKAYKLVDMTTDYDVNQRAEYASNHDIAVISYMLLRIYICILHVVYIISL